MNEYETIYTYVVVPFENGLPILAVAVLGGVIALARQSRRHYYRVQWKPTDPSCTSFTSISTKYIYKYMCIHICIFLSIPHTHSSHSFPASQQSRGFLSANWEQRRAFRRRFVAIDFGANSFVSLLWYTAFLCVRVFRISKPHRELFPRFISLFCDLLSRRQWFHSLGPLLIKPRTIHHLGHRLLPRSPIYTGDL